MKKIIFTKAVLICVYFLLVGLNDINSNPSCNACYEIYEKARDSETTDTCTSEARPCSEGTCKKVIFMKKDKICRSASSGKDSCDTSQKVRGKAKLIFGDCRLTSTKPYKCACDFTNAREVLIEAEYENHRLSGNTCP